MRSVQLVDGFADVQRSKAKHILSACMLDAKMLVVTPADLLSCAVGLDSRRYCVKTRAKVASMAG